MKMSERDRRDWSLLIFILPLGILLMFIAGQFAIRIIPRWILNVTMGSNLKVETAGGQQTFIEPLFNIEILTPFAWQDTYLTPNADKGFVFPPFVVLEPSATPSPTEAPPLTETATPPPPVTVLPSATTITPSATVVVTATTPPPLDTSTPPTDLPTDVPTDTPTVSPTVSPTASPTVSPTVSPTASPTAPPIVSTVDTTIYTPVAATPVTDLGVGVPPDEQIGLIPDGYYVVLGGLSIIVGLTPDNNYDLVYYERDAGTTVNLDWIIIGITNDVDSTDGIQYYEVFNWGNGIPDTNSNVGNLAQPSGTEVDNLPIPIAENTEVPPSQTELYDPDYVDPVSNGPLPQTGILIDVDNASSAPPANTYNYVVIISPPGPGGDVQIDAIQAIEVPIPPTP